MDPSITFGIVHAFDLISTLHPQLVHTEDVYLFFKSIKTID